jgi:hypothetical protein
MINLKSTRSWLLALLLLISVLFMTARAQDHGQDKDGARELKALFEVTVRQGPSTGLVAYGELTLNVTPGTGNFTGSLTPAVSLDTGTPLSTVLFTQSGDSLIPHPSGVAKLDVRGTAQGHAINLIMLDVRGAHKDLAGVGTMENTLKEWLQTGSQGFVGGPAIGPEPGDSGDWLTLCCRLLVLTARTITFGSGLSNLVMNVDSYFFDPLPANQNFTVYISQTANPSSFAGFATNVLFSPPGRFVGGGTLNDLTTSILGIQSGVTYDFTNMSIMSSTVGPSSVRVTFHYQLLTTTTH